MPEPHEQVYFSKKRIIYNNFIGGIAWAVGATIGFAFFIMLFGYFAAQIDFIPIVGTFVAEVNTFITENATK